MVPGFEVADGVSGVISLARGDWKGAALSFAAMWPWGGQAAGAAKMARRAGKVADKVADVGDAGKALEKGAELSKAADAADNVLADTVKAADNVAGAPGSAEHKAAAWKAYRERGGEWNYERWGNVYERNMVRARVANKVVDDYHATLGWGRREVTVDAGGQARRLDIADVATRRGVEVKSGYTTLNEEIRSEIARDALLRGQGWDIRWHFDGKASKPLREALNKLGIPYTGG